MRNRIAVQTIVNAPIEQVWDCWNGLDHISGWAFASGDWQAKPIKNDMRVGGTFLTKMSAKDNSASFDFSGVYTAVTTNKLVEFDLDDKRHVKVEFNQTPEGVLVIETFDPESENPEEMQRSGWQAFLDNFKKYTESTARLS